MEGETIASHLPRKNLVHVAPDPAFAGLNRANQRMGGRVEVFGCMLVLRRIAAADISANHAQTQVHPGIAHLYAFFANMRVGALDFDLIEM